MTHRRMGALLLFVLLVVTATAASSFGQVSAQSAGLPLFGQSGSVWQITSGYNTATHFGEDPYALDIVRVDAPTTGSVVASPVAGRLGFVSTECLTISDSLSLRPAELDDAEIYLQMVADNYDRLLEWHSAPNPPNTIE